MPNEISMCFKEGLFCESLISNIQLMAPMTCFCLLAIFASFMAVIADGLYDGIYKCLSTLKLKKKWMYEGGEGGYGKGYGWTHQGEDEGRLVY